MGARDEAPPAISVEIGKRLRAARTAKGLSVDDVVRISGDRWSASAIGMYERANRAIKVTHLSAFADLYGVPMAVLVGGGGEAPVSWDRPLVIDLVALDQGNRTDPRLERLRAFVRSIIAQRTYFQGRVLALREGDLHTVRLLICAESREGTWEQLDAWGVLAGVPA